MPAASLRGGAGHDYKLPPGARPPAPYPLARFRQPAKPLGQALAIGAGAALGLTLYLWATRQQLLALAVVLASLYPAIPTVLGFAMLHERVSRRQVVGLLGAGAAIVLLTLG